MVMDNYEATLQRAGRKLNFAKNSLMGANGSIRDSDGYQMTCRRITSALENFMNSGFSNKYSLDESLLAGWKRNMNFSRRNFSSSDLQTVQDCDVVDISIAATVASHGLTYIAMERPMESVRQEVSFQGLKALNDVAPYSKGDVVFDPRVAINPELDLGRDSGSAKSTVTLVLNEAIPAGLTVANDGTFAGNTALHSPVILGTTKLVVHTFSDTANAVEIGEGVEYAFDPKANNVPASGIVPMVLKKGGLLDSSSVNIEDGSVALKLISSLITLTSDASPVVDKSATGAAIAAALSGSTAVKGVTIEVITCVDRIAESNGAHTLKLTPFVDSKTLVAEDNRIVLQSSVEVQAQMNKILRKNAQYGIDTDFGKRAIDQIIALYTYYIDTNIVKALWKGVKDAPVAASLDLSGFGNASGAGAWGYNANVKNDALGLFTNDLCQALLVSTQQPVTALIVDDVAALMYASDKESFIPDPAFLQRRDGFIGTYQGIPVVRNYWLHGKGSVATNGVVIGVFKSPDGQAAPVAFGDYLPPYSTLPALNPQNPGELSQALFSSTATLCVVPGWAVKGEITAYSRP